MDNGDLLRAIGFEPWPTYKWTAADKLIDEVLNGDRGAILGHMETAEMFMKNHEALALKPGAYQIGGVLVESVSPIGVRYDRATGRILAWRELPDGEWQEVDK